MKTAILLGAGASMPAGFPSTDCLTTSMLSGAGIQRNSDCTYQPTESDDDVRAVVKLVNCAVRHIHGKAKRYFEEWKRKPAALRAPLLLGQAVVGRRTGRKWKIPPLVRSPRN